MTTIAIGTNSEQKLNYLKEVLKEIDLKAEIKPVKTESGISEQPTTEFETKEGSLNRAKNALNEIPKAKIGLGIEIGYDTKNEKYNMFCYATIVDRKGKIIIAKSHEFPLPNFHDSKIKSSKYLGDHVKDYEPTHNKGVKRFIREMIQHRKPFIIEACRSALLQYFEN